MRTASEARRLIRGLALAIAATALAGCARAPQQSRDRGLCAPLFQEYDRIARIAGPDRDDPRTGVAVFDARLSQLIVLLVRHDCLTRPRDLERLDAVAAARGGRGVAERGAALGRPVAVHVGVMTSEAEAARAVAFFEGLGLRATGLGAPRLGRRVFVGPVTSEGALAEVLQIAREAGFVAPYPSAVFRF